MPQKHMCPISSAVMIVVLSGEMPIALTLALWTVSLCTSLQSLYVNTLISPVSSPTTTS